MSKTPEERRTLSGAVIDAMRSAGWLRSDGYSLKDGFTGIHQVSDVVETKTRTSTELNNFMVHCKAENFTGVIPGSVIANARIIEDANELKNATPVDGVKSIFFSENIEGVMNSSVVFNESERMGDAGYVLPESFNIVGAVVTKNADTDMPTMPLRKYKGHQAVLRHHRALIEDANGFITKDLFKEYLAEGVKGVKERELTLLDSIDEKDSKHWNFTLLLADIA